MFSRLDTSFAAVVTSSNGFSSISSPASQVSQVNDVHVNQEHHQHNHQQHHHQLHQTQEVKENVKIKGKFYNRRVGFLEHRLCAKALLVECGAPHLQMLLKDLLYQKFLLKFTEKTPMCLINELARHNKIAHQYRLTDESGIFLNDSIFYKKQLPIDFSSLFQCRFWANSKIFLFLSYITAESDFIVNMI